MPAATAPMKHLLLEMPVHLHTRAKIRAIEEHKGLYAWILETVEKRLAREGERPRPGDSASN